MSTKKEVREILDLIRSLGGVVIETTHNKHICMRVRFGCVERKIPVATTNSDYHGHRNKIALIKRIAREAGATA